MTTGSPPDTHSTSLPIKAGDVIGVDNKSSALMFATGVLGEYPSLFSPELPDGSPATKPEALAADAGYQLQINAQIEPTPSTVVNPPPGVKGGGGGGGPVAPGGGKPQSASTLAGLQIAPKNFSAAPSGNSIAGGKKGTGATVSYTDSQTGTATFTILQSQPGHRTASGACVKPPLKHHEKRCTRLVALAHFTHVDAVGANRFHFTGRINGRRLKPGRYQLRATARDSAGLVSRPVVSEFRILSQT
jgi:hypothetical protein